MHHSYKNKINPWVPVDIFSHIPPKAFKDILLRCSQYISTFISHQQEIVSFTGLLLCAWEILESMNLIKKLSSKVNEYRKKRKIEEIQIQLFEEIFEKKDSYVGVYGTDERRPEVAVPPKPDKHGQEICKYGFAEWLQFDVMALTEFDETLQKAGIVKEPEKWRMGVGNFGGFLKGKNIHASGGPVPNKITAEIMKNFPLCFDLSNPLYPLRTLNCPEGYKPEYDESRQEYSRDYGVIIISPNPRDNSKRCLATFGCRAYGSLAAAKALTLDKNFKITDYEYEISKIDDKIIKNVEEGIKKRENFYIVVEVEIENGQIVKIETCEGPIYSSEWSQEDLRNFQQLSKDGKPL